ncbi:MULTISPECIES: hypothetical protein [Enterobacteriaceae]|nr:MULTISPECIES: hypothetical protein [Enterobacteriaceae]AZQ80768.1 hypothetical protein EKM58_14185 [Escherichia coli]AZU80349.1 hypothetical protein ELF07_08545 [Escherichia coli]MBC5035822.1 hypothetical protein [Klebsiella variicola]MCX2361905.1 hypothetical protein [Klebsiella variicola]
MSYQENDRLKDINMLLSKQRMLLNELQGVFSERDVYLFNNVLSYIKNNVDKSYYPIKVLREASRCESDADLLKLVRYFCGAHSKLFNINYCYYDFDNEEVPISAECYYKALIKGIAPISLDSGREIDDFDVNNISFYCILNVK